MSEVVGEAVLNLVVDETGADFNKIGAQAQAGGDSAGGKFSKGFLGSMKGLALAAGGVFAAAGIGSFLKDSIAGAQESAKIAATTAQIIQSTGKAAGVSAAQVGDLATQLSRATGIDDELIQSGQNLILTFKNVKNAGQGADAIFNRTTSAALDLSKAGFGSVESASLQLGKALNDPIKGISALARSGVTFTEGQKAQIKALVETGDLLSAQKIILGEVESQVGGVAEATATNADRAKVAWGNIQEQVGGLLLPVLEKLAGFFVDTMVPSIESLVSASSSLGPVFSGIGAAIGAVFASGAGGDSSFFGDLVTQAQALLPIIQSVASQIGSALGPVLLSLAGYAEAVFPLIADVITSQVLPAVTDLASFFAENIVPVFTAVADVVATSIIPALTDVATFIVGQVIPAIVEIATQVGSNLAPVFQTLAEVFTTQILPGVQQAVTVFREQLLPALEPIIGVVINVVGALLKFASAVLGTVLPPVLRFVGFIIGNLIPAIAGLIAIVVQIIAKAIELGGAVGRAGAAVGRFAANIASTVANAVSSVVSAIASLPGKITGFVGRMLEAGKELIGGLFRGITNAAKNAGSFVGDLASRVMEAVRNAVNNALNLPLTISFHKGPINIDATLIPRFAKGTLSAPGGTALVGEQGPELVDLPAGSRVFTAQRTRQMIGSGDGIDYVALASAIAAALAPFLQPVVIQTTADDPEAVAMQVANRLVSAAG